MLPMTRRQLLAGLASLPAPISPRPTLVVETYIWMLEAQIRKVPLVQIVEEAFATTRNAGFRKLELMSAFLEPEVRDRTLAALRNSGIEPTIVYVSGPIHDQQAGDTIERALEFARIGKGAGARWVDLSTTEKRGGRKSDAELTSEADALNRLAREFKSLGLSMLVHHHIPEMNDDAREWRHHLLRTDPALVSFCVDVDWALRGGQNPLVLIREAGPRLGGLHLRNLRQGVPLESVEDGDVNLRAIAGHLKRSRYRGFTGVELVYEKNTRLTRPLGENLRLSRVYVEEVFGSRA